MIRYQGGGGRDGGEEPVEVGDRLSWCVELRRRDHDLLFNTSIRTVNTAHKSNGRERGKMTRRTMDANEIGSEEGRKP